MAVFLGGGCSKSEEKITDAKEASSVVSPKSIADTVYMNGSVYTVSEKPPWAEAVTIKDGKFIN